MGDQDRYVHLKEVFVHFIKKRPTSTLELVFKDEAGVKHKSRKFKEGNLVHWNIDTYVQIHTRATLTIQRELFKISVAQIEIELKPNEFGDNSSVEFEDHNHRVAVNFVCGRSASLEDLTRVYGPQARTNLTSRVLRFLKFPRPAALPLPTVKRARNVQYPAIHWLNNDVLLDIFDCYRLNVKHVWNERLWWGKLPHVCQRWRHLIYEFAFRLGMYIKCTNLNGTRIVDMLEQLPPLPLFIRVTYGQPRHTTLTEQQELGLYHALQLHDRVRHIDLELPPSILHRVFVLPDKEFPILEHLSISLGTTTEKIRRLLLPNAFRAPNLRYLALPSIRPPRELQLLDSTLSLVTLVLSNIETSSYFRPRLLVTRLQFLPQLKELSIGFSTLIPRPGTERGLLLGGQRSPVTLLSLEILQFKGANTYLESLVAQIRAPRLERLWITLFNEITFAPSELSYLIAFALPHLSYLIDITEAFKLLNANVFFDHNAVYITTVHHGSLQYERGPFLLRVMCDQLNHQIHCASQICQSLTLALSGVEELTLYLHENCWANRIRTELQNSTIDSATWHDLLKSFVGVKKLRICHALLEGLLCRALQVDEVGLDPEFLPNLRCIRASHRGLFASFINTRQVVGRPVQWNRW